MFTIILGGRVHVLLISAHSIFFVATKLHGHGFNRNNSQHFSLAKINMCTIVVRVHAQYSPWLLVVRSALLPPYLQL